jgi:gluconokinase
MDSIVVMGVAGCGKSSLGADLARALGLPLVEGDDFHPPANQQKMRDGIPLTDADRAGWLDALAGELAAAPDGTVLTCSALKRAYRDLLRDGHPSVWFAHVSGDQQLIEERVAHRHHQYMPPSLLPSQFATLEPLQDDEPGRVVPAVGSAEQVVDELLADLQRDLGISLPAG